MLNTRLIIKNYAIKIIIIFIALTVFKCNTNRQESPDVQKLHLCKVTPIDVPEPSALALSFDQKYFWSVGDSDSMVFKLSLNGKVIKSFLVNGDDLEGITVIDSVHLAIVLERTREVVVLDTTERKSTEKN